MEHLAKIDFDAVSRDTMECGTVTADYVQKNVLKKSSPREFFDSKRPQVFELNVSVRNGWGWEHIRSSRTHCRGCLLISVVESKGFIWRVSRSEDFLDKMKLSFAKEA